jgi:hypothetical protein
MIYNRITGCRIPGEGRATATALVFRFRVAGISASGNTEGSWLNSGFGAGLTDLKPGHLDLSCLWRVVSHLWLAPDRRS